MKYGVLFSLVSILLLFYAVSSGGWFLFLLWPALSFGLVAAAYLRFGHSIFGKRPDGSMSFASVLLLLPYLLYLWAVWHIMRFVSREPRCNTLADGIAIGRRLLSHELPPETVTVVDLTCEFPEPTALRSVPCYICFPLLDASGAPPDALAAFARRFSDIEGSIFIHCAQGHGRTGLVSALVLLARGLATNAEDALKQVQASRPLVGLNRVQRYALDKATDLIQSAD